jgi:hypothetical protein
MGSCGPAAQGRATVVQASASDKIVRTRLDATLVLLAALQELGRLAGDLGRRRIKLLNAFLDVLARAYVPMAPAAR